MSLNQKSTYFIFIDDTKRILLKALKFFIRGLGFLRLMKMKMKILKGGSGDCILIHTNGQNLLIDGGNDVEYLFPQIDEIYNRGEILDLLVITHHDEDHILGILKLLQEVKKGRFGNPKLFIRNVLFNSPKKILGIPIPIIDNLLSYKQACEVENLISELELEWNLCTEESEGMKFGKTSLSFLSPISRDITKYGKNQGAYLSSDERCDWNSPIRDLIVNMDDDDLDNTLPNQTSIVILIEHESKKILLTGDVTPKRLNQILTSYNARTGDDYLRLDYFKIPHHGSYRSLTKELLSKINCSNFIISTNSKRYFFPNKRAIVKILSSINNSGESIRFHFNYKESIDKLKINYLEEQKYKLELIPNNKEYGIEIN
ncbi:Metal-dependent hydrolase, beta-lactamase superfamily II [Flavobacteriaceae bacterium MAR_2010_188]|nr:Metal-dependent hydrolase, beta-lactamase superfamily II [Flavobacteriaceae bacterium MAR_2010_188]